MIRSADDKLFNDDDPHGDRVTDGNRQDNNHEGSTCDAYKGNSQS